MEGDGARTTPVRVTARTGHPDFLDLPWAAPLDQWDHARLVDVARGPSRHVVRFVAYGERIYALKELPRRLAAREYDLLRRLAAQSLPVVEAVGVATREVPGESRGRPDPDAVLITRHLEYSLPYRTLFARGATPALQDRLLDAIVGLVVRLHLSGFFWGDCSLSNTLFRRDAGALAAYLVDAETGELHASLSEGQRAHDLAIACENLAGELLDVTAELGLEFPDPVATAEELSGRYGSLWSELTRDEEFAADQRYRIDARLRRLNELGFDVEEIQLVGGPSGYRLVLDPRVVEPGHHRRRLLSLTGIDVQENQARRLLNDMAAFHAVLAEREGRTLPDEVVAYRWARDVFEPAMAMVPADLGHKRDPAELYHEILEHKYLRSAEAGHDIGLGEAVRSYRERVLPGQPDERTILAGEAGDRDPT